MTRLGRRSFLTIGTLGALAACSSPDTPKRWHDGRLFIATGNTTGVFYQLGGGLADVIERHLPGYSARAEPTGASGENIQRVTSGDMDVAFTLADSAADAFRGQNAFKDKPQQIRALSRVYRNYTHVVARTGLGIKSLKDLAGKKVSTSSPNSGTDVLAGRLLKAAGVDPDTGMTRQRLSLPETTKGMKAGTTDAMFFSGGLPTPGITDLLTGPDKAKFELVKSDEVLEPLRQQYGSAYSVGQIEKGVYDQLTPVASICVSILLVVDQSMPENLAYDLTKILYERQQELIEVHPEAGNYDRTSGPDTDPVPLHPGAARYLGKA
ncbi:C4-dicarboxylate ABC transporter substrate-binding protein [Virgisporangium aliadipatigenens]|uniref:C4-dicarboxylate ABC transporter substrate-binding protein n=1 Tax=Virgisporangium aliadipatigenens TaxID=741659 RepID=A0A8J4DQ74_9ACTN|nr:TAXI family TRAP transporter solute-binding subunit [Virgisporangium aliadipatigenens]GIJ46299.1 C4-dicarboxylate ABC transporter substrate-binding protein [Virgisporangium aliadipatigenens]